MTHTQLQEPIHAHAQHLPPAWHTRLQDALAAPSFAALDRYIEQRRQAGATIYPPEPFRALHLTAPDTVRVIILGQDPYHGPGQAQGLAFSVPTGFRRPPSLRNIFLEIAGLPATAGGSGTIQPSLLQEPAHTVDAKTRSAGYDNDLTRWARQGVLLLNTVLTVEDGQPASHARQGWEAFTDAIIHSVARTGPKAFLLWGAHAQAKQALLPEGAGHLVLTANHPSPLSAQRPPQPFLGCAHFAQANAWLRQQGHAPIDWAGA